MKTRKAVVLPKTEDILRQLGEQIRLARLRRDLSVNLVCERAYISRATLWKVEKGDPSVAIGIYAVVLHALDNMDKDLLLVAKDDKVGKTLQDLKIDVRKRASRSVK
ncbi:MAG: helix-turn-helix domain-containing protein [Acholeplasmatales bacterium]|nr:helix-turn-helix domain-containing protein [Acholeplasmatales bacterium]